MKYFLLILTGFISSCGNDTAQQTKADAENKGLEIAGAVSTNTADTVCFLKTAGTTNQDTALIRLVISNDKVTGKMMNLPHETDSRVGKLNGTKEGDIVNCKWTYIQEGMIDSVLVSFKLDGHNLIQKAPWFDPATGKELLPDTATYRIAFDRIRCSGAPMLEYDLSQVGL